MENKFKKCGCCGVKEIKNSEYVFFCDDCNSKIGNINERYIGYYCKKEEFITSEKEYDRLIDEICKKNAKLS